MVAFIPNKVARNSFAFVAVSNINRLILTKSYFNVDVVFIIIRS